MPSMAPSKPAARGSPSLRGLSSSSQDRTYGDAANHSSASKPRLRSAVDSDANPVRRGLYDRIDTAPAGPLQPSPIIHSGPEPTPPPLDPAGDGRGGTAGLHDPYDRPTHRQLLGAQSRLRQDLANGSLRQVASRYRASFAGQHLVRKGLRRSIADAYAAYVGHVVNLPDDVYGMALRTLNRTFNTRSRHPGAIDFNLWSSPFAPSRVKHAQIFNTAHKIMRDMGGYVHDVSYYCPGELDELRSMRRQDVRQGSESYKEKGQQKGSDFPTPQREEVPLARQNASAARRATSRRNYLHDPDHPGPAASPITGAAISQQPPAPTRTAAAEAPAVRHGTAVPPPRPRTAPPVPSARGIRAPSPQDVGRGRGAAAGAGNEEAAAGNGSTNDDAEGHTGNGREERFLQMERHLRRELLRRSTPADFVKTPPHYQVSRYYEHVNANKEDVRQHKLRSARWVEGQRGPLSDGAAAADVAVGPAAGVPPAGGGEERPGGEGGGEAAAGGSAPVEELTFAAMQQVLAIGTEEAAPTAAAAAGAPAASPGQQAARRSSVTQQQAGPHKHQRQQQQQQQPPPAVQYDGGGNFTSTTDRIMWIIETAYELGLAGVLGLEGPPPYPRSHRVWPLPHRVAFYRGVYSSPERYVPYVPPYGQEAPYHSDQGAGRADSPPTPPLRQYQRDGDGGDEAAPYSKPMYGNGAQRFHNKYGDEINSVAFRLQQADARRYVAAGGKYGGRSQRLRP